MYEPSIAEQKDKVRPSAEEFECVYSDCGCSDVCNAEDKR